MTLVDKEDKERELPFGAAVWCTGVKLNPLASQLIETLNEASPGSQTNFRSILVDQYLRVKGSDGSVYALGDAATIEQPRALGKVEELFDKADKEKRGYLKLDQLREILIEGSAEFPHLEEYAEYLNGSQNRFGGMVSRFLSSRGVAGKNDAGKALLLTMDEEGTPLSKEDFRTLLEKIDSCLRLLPPTAQVARQEGEYLAKLHSEVRLKGSKNDIAEGILPFQYNHKGSLAYVGQDKAVMDIPAIGPVMGAGAGLGWKAFETYSQFSLRNRALVFTDWLRSKVFGRDISRF